MDSIFIVFIFRQDEQDYQEFFSPAARGFSAEGRIILTILVDLPARACQPYFVCLRYKSVKRVEFGIEQSLAWQTGPVQLFSLR
jgi:hypothetical protein